MFRWSSSISPLSGGLKILTATVSSKASVLQALKIKSAAEIAETKPPINENTVDIFCTWRWQMRFVGDLTKKNAE